jgi:hypothetical protein
MADSEKARLMTVPPSIGRKGRPLGRLFCGNIDIWAAVILLYWYIYLPKYRSVDGITAMP